MLLKKDLSNKKSSRPSFLQNKVFPLDVKLNNIGYLEKGKVEHFDFSSSIILDINNKNGFSYDTTPSIIFKSERIALRELLDKRDFEGAEPLLHPYITDVESVFPKETIL